MQSSPNAARSSSLSMVQILGIFIENYRISLIYYIFNSPCCIERRLFHYFW